MLLKSDPIKRSRTRMHEDYDRVSIVNEQDIEPVMEAAHELRRHYRGAKTIMGESGEHVGKIPTIIWQKLCDEGIAWDDEALLEWLQRPENKAFKIHPGRFV